MIDVSCWPTSAQTPWPAYAMAMPTTPERRAPPRLEECFFEVEVSCNDCVLDGIYGSEEEA